MKRFTITMAALSLAATGCQSILGIDDVALRDGGGSAIDGGPTDAAPPSSTIQATLVQFPPLLTNVQETTFTFTAPLGSTGFECRLDGGSFTACSSPHLFNADEGNRQFEVRALDAEGDGPPVTYNWEVDITDPGTVITVMPEDPIVGNTVVFEFDSFPPETGDRFECRLSEQGVFSPCTSGEAFVLGDGNFDLQVRAHDAAGNFDGTPAAHSFLIETGSPPDTIITGSPPGTTNSNSLEFTFISTQPATSTFDCRVTPGGSFDTCISPHSVTLPSDGTFTFEVRAIGMNGPDESPDSHVFVFDSTPPIVTITNGPENPETLRTASFEFSANEPALFQCSLNGGAFAPCQSPHDLSNLETENHTMRIRAIDLAQNPSMSAAIHSWAVGIIVFESMAVNGSLQSFVLPPEGSFVDAGPDISTGRQTANEACLGQQQFNGALAGLEISAVICVAAGDSVVTMQEILPIPLDSPIIGLQKEPVALNWPDFTGGATLLNSLADAGVGGGSSDQVWMGCFENGSTDIDHTCKSWNGSAAGSFGAVATTLAVDSSWLLDPSQMPACVDSRPVLCVAY